jgi:predicted Fe-S protein YdhL (DUF1289 family)
MTAMPVSPCIGVCLIDPASGYCRGCLRSTAEIAAWYRAGSEEKRAILARLERRRAASGDGGVASEINTGPGSDRSR